MEVHNSVIEAEVLLKNYGVVLLKGILDTAQLSLVTRSATQCFSYIEQIIHEQGIEQVSDYLPFYYFFNIRVTSVSLFALDDDQVTHAFEKISIVVNSLAYQVLAKIMDSSLLFNLSQSWVTR
ncbi:hypothetical protein [Coleofasciculus chthonoplastes]|jgi:hypothetical protein|uniref:hypothetical protein n=1 Tax=Coleofasciculus chthonoplastes TaxID=64178 RepID=UPI0032F5963B